MLTWGQYLQTAVNTFEKSLKAKEQENQEENKAEVGLGARGDRPTGRKPGPCPASPDFRGQHRGCDMNSNMNGFQEVFEY